jgi:hypothetical protein
MPGVSGAGAEFRISYPMVPRPHFSCEKSELAPDCATLLSTQNHDYEGYGCNDQNQSANFSGNVIRSGLIEV